MRPAMMWMTTVAACALLAPNAAGQVTFDDLFFSDYDGNNVVDASDYVIWRDSFGDFDQNGSSDAAAGSDLADWQANYGRTPSSAGGPSQNKFNGSTAGDPVSPGLPLVWRSVPLAPLFDSQAQYDGWVAPFSSAASVAGDYDGDGDVDAADYVIWRKVVLDNATLEKFLAISGDFNGDGDVDGRDFLIWQRNLGDAGNINTPSGFAPADFDTNGDVDAADYVVWRKGNLSIPLTVGNDWWAAVPEPTSLTLLALGSALALTRRRGR